MNTKGKIVLIVSILFSVLCLIYAFLQKLEADKNFSLAEQRKMQAEAIKVELEKTKQLAEKAKAEAIKQQFLAAQVMADCEKKIKK